ncbi:transposase [Alteromonas sp. 38]|uniref:transposase n=1 Tax=unclassified Alteromonas TaxID=2614992 RepID=UPI0012EF9032|nr:MULTISPECIES: transposase [unclassified Alteromonas]CAD5291812.1 transposase [Alteromonas sp. 154]VXB18717.1 transposase [Alteromonas sp. 38]
MPKARKSQISLLDTPYYHCVSRCVRRAFLCGEQDGKSFEHRRQWVEDRIHTLSEVFAIDVCAYAVMSNHTHVVLHVAKDKADAFTTEEIIQRWHKLYKGTLLTQRYLSPELCKDLHETQIKTVEETAVVWRKRLIDISWFMRALNEYIARAANKEDDCTGHFWEGRFKSQALLDESALAACMAYVDLNPVRAKIAKTPETSAHTSIQYRINAARVGKTPKRLMPFAGSPKQNMFQGLPFTLPDYLQLVDITSRYIHPNKRGIVEHSLPTILERLNIEHEQWLILTTQFETCFKHAAGKVIHLEQYAHNQYQQRVQGRQSARRLLG